MPTLSVIVWYFHSIPKRMGFGNPKIVENSIQNRSFLTPKPVSKIKSQNILEKLTFEPETTGANLALTIIVDIVVRGGKIMKQVISTMDMRHNLGDILNRVDLRHDQFVIERKGKPLAALIPIVLWEQIQSSAKTYALEFLRSRPSDLSDEEAMEIANQAKKSVRRKS